MYAPMLAWWLEYFDSGQLMVLNSKEVAANPIQVANRIARFTGVDDVFSSSMLVDPATGRERELVQRQPGWRPPTKRMQMEIQNARAVLDQFYAPLNEQLYALLEEHGIEFPRFGSDGLS